MLTQENKQEIYEILTNHFKVNETYSLAAVGKFLSSKGYNARRFGYTQMKKMLKDIPEFMELQEYQQDGHENCRVILREKRENAGKKNGKPFSSRVSLEETQMAEEDQYSLKKGETRDRIPLTVFQRAGTERITSSNRTYSNFSRNYGNNRADNAEADSRSTSGGVRFTSGAGTSTFKETPVKETVKAEESIRNPKKTINDKEEGSSFERLAYLPPKVLDFLERKGIDNPADALNDSYLKSIRAKTYQQRRDTIMFPFCPENGENMMAVLKRNEKTYGKPWYLSYVGAQMEEKESTEEVRTGDEETRTQVPGKALEDFADIGYWQEFLKELAETALPENWDFRGNRENGRFYILKKYIQYTFYRLQQEEKVAVAAGNFAAFNTGLVNNRYQEIYACFVPNPKHDANETLPEWKFEAFAIAGQRGKDGYGKLLTSYFNPLPQLPAYYESITDLFYDLSAPLVTDYEHIIIDNIDRLPVEYLRECFFSDDEAQELLRRTETASAREKKAAYYNLSSYIMDNDRIYRRMKDRMEDAIEMALKRVRWNFRTAVPCYFPKGNCISLMLPLALAEDTQTDAALIVKKNPSGSYQGQTILELDKAYLDARLLCRPNIDWMAVENIRENGSKLPEKSPVNEDEKQTENAAPTRGETYRSDYGRVQTERLARYNGYQGRINKYQGKGTGEQVENSRNRGQNRGRN